MIGRLRGIILEKQLSQLLLEANGVGYEIQVPTTCFYNLPDIGCETIIYTHLIIKEDIQTLFGFINKQQQYLFRTLIKINGIGPKLGLTILSKISIQQFVEAVKHQKINFLAKLPGIGEKTAEHLIIEMKNRLRSLSNNIYSTITINETSSTIDVNNMQEANIEKIEKEAIAALMVLGYKYRKASQMINKVIRADVDCNSLVRDALRATL